MWSLTLGWFTSRATLGLVHGLADRERARLGRWGAEVAPPDGRPDRLREALRDPATRAELHWLARHAVAGTVVGFLAVLAPFSAVRDLTFPLWWWTLPDGWASPSLGLWVVHDWSGVPAVVGARRWRGRPSRRRGCPLAARRQLRVSRGGCSARRPAT